MLLTHSHGSGWFTCNEIPEIVFDPYIVEAVLSATPHTLIMDYCERTYDGGGHGNYWAAASVLRVLWVDQGEDFRIEEYDGKEYVVLKRAQTWLTA